MNVFVAGGTGAIGFPLVRALVASKHRVFATTRSRAKESMIRALGATPVVVDALDATALEKAVREAAPTHVIHQLTALPKTGPRRASDLEPTNRLRDEGTRNLLKAAIAARAQRIVIGSFALIGAAKTIDDPQIDRAAEAVRSMESQAVEAARRGDIEAIVLRYGLFYGPGNPATDEMIALVRRRWLPRVRNDRGQLPYIHMDDAVAATMAALERGQSGSVYDIVDDQPASFSDIVAELADVAGARPPLTVSPWLVRLAAPYMARLFMLQLPLSNAAARRELGWAPIFPSYREGLKTTVPRSEVVRRSGSGSGFDVRSSATNKLDAERRTSN
jgi:nucleoside-diphosphate-sugar epimerase